MWDSIDSLASGACVSLHGQFCFQTCHGPSDKTLQYIQGLLQHSLYDVHQLPNCGMADLWQHTILLWGQRLHGETRNQESSISNALLFDNWILLDGCYTIPVAFNPVCDLHSGAGRENESAQHLSGEIEPYIFWFWSYSPLDRERMRDMYPWVRSHRQSYPLEVSSHAYFPHPLHRWVGQVR